MSEQQTQNEPRELALPKIGTIADLMKEQGAKEYASFDPQTPDGAALLLKATMEKLPSIKSKVKEYLNVVHVFAHEVTSQPEDDGLVKTYQRTVIFDDKGQGYDCGSLGVAKSIGIISRIRGMPPFDPPVKCLVVLQDLEGRKQWLTLLPDIDSLLTRNKLTPSKKEETSDVQDHGKRRRSHGDGIPASQ